jgi:hypothetical protein
MTWVLLQKYNNIFSVIILISFLQHQECKALTPFPFPKVKQRSTKILKPLSKKCARLPPVIDSQSSLNMIWPKKDPNCMATDYPQTKSRCVSSILATLATWHAISHSKISPVLASSTATLVMSLWSPGLGQAAFCGSFAGMSCAGSLGSTLTAAVITSLLFELWIHRQKKWLGLGGRLGLVAFLSTNFVAWLHGNPAVLEIPKSLASWNAVFKSSPYFYAMTCGALGSMATIILREQAETSSNQGNDLNDPVRAAATIGAVASLMVGVWGLDKFGALVAFGGAFTGMSLPSRLLKGVIPGRKQRNLPNAFAIVTSYGAAGAMGGLIHALTIPLNWWSGGVWGGKAGACAFGGVLVFRMLEDIVFQFQEIMGYAS